MKILSFLTLLIFISSCTNNVYDELADKETPEAVFFDAKQRINERDFSAAITLLESLDNAFLTARIRVPIYASAYSGRCGLVLLDLLNNLTNTGSSTVLGTLMASFNSATTAQIADCMQAESIMETNIGGLTSRDGDENLFMAFNSLAKVAAILSAYADTDNDDVADAGFSPCRDVNTPGTGLPENMVRQIGTGIGVALSSLGAVGSGYIDGAITEVDNLCNADPNLVVFCDASDPSVFGPAEVAALRIMVASSDFGINTCAGENFNDCAASFPANCPL